MFYASVVQPRIGQTPHIPVASCGSSKYPHAVHWFRFFSSSELVWVTQIQRCPHPTTYVLENLQLHQPFWAKREKAETRTVHRICLSSSDIKRNDSRRILDTVVLKVKVVDRPEQ